MFVVFPTLSNLLLAGVRFCATIKCQTMRFLIFFIFILAFASCRKKIETTSLSELEYRIVNNGDANIASFVIWTNVSLPDDGSSFGPSAAFNNIGPFDTVTLKITDVTNTGINFLNAFRSFQLRVWYRKKVFSPLYYSHNFIVEGDPYAIGWTYTQTYSPASIDTVTRVDKKIFYINWPSDSIKLKEYW